MKSFLLWVLLGAISLALFGCKGLLEKVPSNLQLSIVDEYGQPYGYLSVTLLEQGKPIASSNANERGIVMFGKEEGMKAGTYTLRITNVAQLEMEVIEPQSIAIGPGRTIQVTVKVRRPQNTQ